MDRGLLLFVDLTRSIGEKRPLAGLLKRGYWRRESWVRDTRDYRVRCPEGAGPHCGTGLHDNHGRTFP